MNATATSTYKTPKTLTDILTICHVTATDHTMFMFTNTKVKISCKRNVIKSLMSE